MANVYEIELFNITQYANSNVVAHFDELVRTHHPHHISVLRDEEPMSVEDAKDIYDWIISAVSPVLREQFRCSFAYCQFGWYRALEEFVVLGAHGLNCKFEALVESTLSRDVAPVTALESGECQFDQVVRVQPKRRIFTPFWIRPITYSLSAQFLMFLMEPNPRNSSFIGAFDSFRTKMGLQPKSSAVGLSPTYVNELRSTYLFAKSYLRFLFADL